MVTSKCGVKGTKFSFKSQLGKGLETDGSFKKKSDSDFYSSQSSVGQILGGRNNCEKVSPRQLKKYHKDIYPNERFEVAKVKKGKRQIFCEILQ